MPLHLTIPTAPPSMPPNAACYWTVDVGAHDEEGGYYVTALDCPNPPTHMEFDRLNDAWHATCDACCSHVNAGIVCERSMLVTA